MTAHTQPTAVQHQGYMKLDLGNGTVVELPQQYNTEERIAFCDELTQRYPDKFEYKIPSPKEYRSTGEMVERRLSLLGSYILNSIPKDEFDDYTVQTIHKERRDRFNEIPLGEIEYWGVDQYERIEKRGKR